MSDLLETEATSAFRLDTKHAYLISKSSITNPQKETDNAYISNGMVSAYKTVHV